MRIVDKVIRKIETCVYTRKIFTLTGKEKQLNTERRDVEIVASLTSYPARFDNLHLVIESIFRQTCKPDKIILYLDDGIKEESLPDKLLELKKCGLSIIIGGANIKPHKKYYYAMQSNPDSIVVTFDDDNLYRKDTIEKLMKSYHKHPEAVSCMRAHRMIFDTQNQLLPYNDWDLVCTKYIDEPRADLLATGVGGVLYPPHCMHTDLFDLEKIKNLSLGADDIWLKIMQLLNHTKVVAVESKMKLANPLPTDSRSISALSVDNVSYSANDKYLSKLADYYDFDYYELIHQSIKGEDNE